MEETNRKLDKIMELLEKIVKGQRNDITCNTPSLGGGGGITSTYALHQHEPDNYYQNSLGFRCRQCGEYYQRNQL